MLTRQALQMLRSDSSSWCGLLQRRQLLLRKLLWLRLLATNIPFETPWPLAVLPVVSGQDQVPIQRASYTEGF